MSDTRKELESSVEHAMGMVAFLDGLTSYGTVAELIEDRRLTIEQTGEYPVWDIEDAEELDAEADVFDVLDSWALDWYTVIHRRGTDSDIASHVIVFATGGPHIEAEVSVGGNVEVRGHWASDGIAKFGLANGLADFLSDLAKDYGI